MRCLTSVLRFSRADRRGATLLNANRQELQLPIATEGKMFLGLFVDLSVRVVACLWPWRGLELYRKIGLDEAITAFACVCNEVPWLTVTVTGAPEAPGQPVRVRPRRSHRDLAGCWDREVSWSHACTHTEYRLTPPLTFPAKILLRMSIPDCPDSTNSR